MSGDVTDAAVLAALDFTPTCSHLACDRPAERTLHGYHLAPSGQGWDEGDECLPCRFVYCRKHAKGLEKLGGRVARSGSRVVCRAHGREVVVQWTDLAPPPAQG